MTTPQYARLVAGWVAGIGLDPHIFSAHSLRRTKATLIYRRTGKMESTVRYLGIEVDDALAIAGSRSLKYPGRADIALPGY